MSEQVKIPDPVYEKAQELVEERDTSIKEAIRIMCREGGYDV